MKIETFEKAKDIREAISHWEKEKAMVEKMHKKLHDDEVTKLTELAHNAICIIIQRLESDFNNL